MKILLINKFLYRRGGDAITALDEGKLLSSKGHEVIFWGMDHPMNPHYKYGGHFVSPVDFNNPGGLYKKFKILLNLLYFFEARNKLDVLLRETKPDIVHLHNIAHHISPSILDAIKKHGIPMVMTLHDYKMVCASYRLMSHNKICNLCENGRYYHCFLEGCVKNSISKSLVNTVEMYLHHKMLHIYDNVDFFISPSIFLKSMLEKMGCKKRIVYLPNFVFAEHFHPQFAWQEKSIVYFGRLSEEKGLFTLLKAMKRIKTIRLKIIGKGPMRRALELEVKNCSLTNVQFLGYKSGKELYDEIKKSMFVVLPSEWYENNPRALLEAFALGKPAIGSDLGGISEVIKSDETGLLFKPCNVEDLRSKISYLANNPNMILEMGRKARLFAEEKFNSEAHYLGLKSIYNKARLD